MKNRPVKSQQLKDLPKGKYDTIIVPSRRMKAEAKRRAKIKRRWFGNQ
jgi:hypothetical protein